MVELNYYGKIIVDSQKCKRKKENQNVIKPLKSSENIHHKRFNVLFYTRSLSNEEHSDRDSLIYSILNTCLFVQKKLCDKVMF